MVVEVVEVEVVAATLVTVPAPMAAVYLQALSVPLSQVAHVTRVKPQAIGEVVPSPIPAVPTQSPVELVANLITPHPLFDIL